MKIDILDNYEFLEVLVKDGQLDPAQPFRNDGVCYASKCKRFIYVFHFFKTEIWATYGYAEVYNKEFLKFHNIIANALLNTGLPVLRVGKNNDLKRHFIKYKIIDGVQVYRLKGF